jgi:hypothetical protein
MLLGVVAAALSVVAPLGVIASLACRAADPFLAALVTIAEHASTLPAATLSLSGPTRLLPTVAVLVCTLVARRRATALMLEREATAERNRRFRSSQPRFDASAQHHRSSSARHASTGITSSRPRL